MKILLPQELLFFTRNNNINLSSAPVLWCVGWCWGSREVDGRVEVVVVSLYDSKILIVVLYDCNQQTNDWSEPCKYPGSSADQWLLSVLSLSSGHLTGYHILHTTTSPTASITNTSYTGLEIWDLPPYTGHEWVYIDKKSNSPSEPYLWWLWVWGVSRCPSCKRWEPGTYILSWLTGLPSRRNVKKSLNQPAYATLIGFNVRDGMTQPA